MALTDYGAEAMLDSMFNNASVFQLALFLSGTPDDTPVLEEVDVTDYIRVDLTGSDGAIEWQTQEGLASTIDAGIATWRWDSAVTPMEFEFLGALGSTNKTIIGYAILFPSSAAPFAASACIDTGLLASSYTPANAGDKLIINSISVRLSKGAVS